MLGRMWMAVLLAAVCGGATCEPGQRAHLLELHRATPTLLAAGELLEIHGRGFPTGAQAELLLRGEVRRPGERPREVSATLHGRATGADRVQLPLDEAQLAAFGGSGSFSGELTVAFQAAEPGTRVVGVLPVEFDLVQPTAQALRARHRLRKRATRLLTFLGIEAEPGQSMQEGLTVLRARPDSRALAAGLSPGDVIVRAAGVGVHSLSDLAPPPDLDAIALRVTRPARPEATELLISVAGFDSPSLASHLLPVCIAATAALLCLLAIGPLPSLGVWLSRCRSRLSHGPGHAWTRIWDDRAPTPDPTGRLGARLMELGLAWLLPLTVATLLFTGALLHPVHGLRFNSLHIYLGLTALSVGLTLSLSGGLSTAARGAHARTQLARMAVVGVVIGCACALSGTRSLGGIMLAQGGTPTRWLVFSQPAMFVLFPVFVMHASRLIPLELGRGARAHAAAFVLDVGGRVVLSAIGTAIFLGGYQTTGIPHADRLDPYLLGAALFTLKAWGLGLLLHLRRTMGTRNARALRFSMWACVSGVLLTALWVHLGVGAELGLAIGHVLATASLGALLLASWQVLRSPHPMGSPPSYWVADGA